MPVLTGTIEDVGGSTPDGYLAVRAKQPRKGASDATIGTSIRNVAVVDGVIDPTELDPGPIQLQVFVGNWNQVFENLVVPETDVDLWDLLEATAVYEPPVVSQVYRDRLAAEAAAEEAARVAAGIADIGEQADQVADDRAAIELSAVAVSEDALDAVSAADDAQTSANFASQSASQAAGSASDASTARSGAQAAQSAAESARDGAQTAATTASGYADAAEGSAQDAAGSADAAAAYVGGVADDVVTTVKLRDRAVTGVKLALEAVTNEHIAVGSLSQDRIAGTGAFTDSIASKLDQSQVQALIDRSRDDLVDSAPGTLDTLNEIAAALGKDPNFAATMTQELAGKAATSHTHLAVHISDSSSVGRSVLTAADAAGARTAIDAAPTTHTHTVSDVSGLDSALASKTQALVVPALPSEPQEGVLYLILEEA